MTAAQLTETPVTLSLHDMLQRQQQQRQHVAKPFQVVLPHRSFSTCDKISARRFVSGLAVAATNTAAKMMSKTLPPTSQLCNMETTLSYAVAGCSIARGSDPEVTNAAM